MDTSYHSFSQIPVKDLVAICHIDITTARRWRRGSNLPPTYVLAFVNAKVTGDMGFLDPSWKGWKLIRGCLYSPESWEIRMHDVLATPLLRHQLAAYQTENRHLKIELADALANRLEEQPQSEDWALPANWVITG
jgi:hypothetical protein